MRKTVALFRCALCVALISLSLFAFARAEGEPRCRALLIACDEFLTAADTAPIAHNNLNAMETILRQDTRGFEVYRQDGIIFSPEILEYAIGRAFEGAQAGDISLLYFCTHGEFDPAFNNPQGQLLLSDGSLEGRVSAQALQAMLDKIPGTKLLIVDACNSGSLIGKGIAPDVGLARVGYAFETGDYHVLTSSGGSEPSWYWKTTLEDAPPGSSYFTTALADAAGLHGTFAADANGDGVIALHEMYNHLWVNQASSTAQMYPQDDDFPLIVYDRALAYDADRQAPLTGFVFHSTALSPEDMELNFSYTATTEARVAYRITFLRDGQWDWRNAVTRMDFEESEGETEGMVSAGRKVRTLDFSRLTDAKWDYAMIHVMTLGEATEHPHIYASRVLSLRAGGGDPALSIQTNELWQASIQPELRVFVGHAAPIDLSLIVRDAQGKTVRRLCLSRPTRPQSLSPEGSLFYWNGLDDEGAPVSGGEYTIHAAARVGEARYETEHRVRVVREDIKE